MNRRPNLFLLWAVGVSLRITILAVPPLIPSIHADLMLDEKAVALLTGLPVLLFSLAAIPGSFLVARSGNRRGVVVGLAIISIGGALRGVGPSVPTLFVMTLLMGVGVAIVQPAVPALIAVWFPNSVGRATAAYVNGLLVGEIAGSSLAVPVALPIANMSWELAIAVWSLPVAITAVAMLVSSRAPTTEERLERHLWWPDWRDPLLWRLGILLAAAQIPYWGTNALLPDYLHAMGRDESIAAALAALNVLQIPASALIALGPARFVGRRWPFIVSGIVFTACGIGLIALRGTLSILWTGVLGFTAGFVFILGLALVPLVAKERDVHRFGAAVFTLSYAGAFMGPFVAGSLWDALALPGLGFVPLIGAGIVVALLGRTIPRLAFEKAPRTEASAS